MNGPDPRRIHSMFSSVASRYDRANTVLSGGIHHLWRRKAVRMSGIQRGDRVLDCATGTGDLAIAFRSRGANVVGIDFVEAMLEVARRKAPDIEFRQADAMALPFESNTFDAASIAFGIRNVAEPSKAIREMARVVSPGGRVVVLEFGQPRGVFGGLYRAYSRHVLPRIGGLLTGDRAAYEYLESSAARFPSGDAFVSLMRSSADFESIRAVPLTFGIACLYVATKAR